MLPNKVTKLLQTRSCHVSNNYFSHNFLNNFVKKQWDNGKKLKNRVFEVDN